LVKTQRNVDQDDNVRFGQALEMDTYIYIYMYVKNNLDR